MDDTQFFLNVYMDVSELSDGEIVETNKDHFQEDGSRWGGASRVSLDIREICLLWFILELHMVKFWSRVK